MQCFSDASIRELEDVNAGTIWSPLLVEFSILLKNLKYTYLLTEQEEEHEAYHSMPSLYI